jgi:hypothetical protein
VFHARVKPKGPVAEVVVEEEVKAEAGPDLTGPPLAESRLDMAMATLALTPMETVTPKDMTLTRIRCVARGLWGCFLKTVMRRPCTSRCQTQCAKCVWVSLSRSPAVRFFPCVGQQSLYTLRDPAFLSLDVRTIHFY